jgi:uncharacterized membrane protein YdjX (TVP38/TMEM64 family)
VARTALKDLLERKSTYFLKMKKGFENNAWNYLLFLRLVPAFPFWLANLAPAFFGIPLFTFLWTTLVGLIPVSFLFAQTGAGMGSLLESGQEITLKNLLNPNIKVALISLAIFAPIPLLLRKYMSTKASL